MLFGEILAELRQDKGLLQKDIAALINVSVSTISNYETGAHFPDINTVIVLADYFNISIDYLLGRTVFRMKFSDLNKSLNDNMDVAKLMNKVLSYDEKNIGSLLDFMSLLDLRK